MLLCVCVCMCGCVLQGSAKKKKIIIIMNDTCNAKSTVGCDLFFFSFSDVFYVCVTMPLRDCFSHCCCYFSPQ